tara:strand:+ start:2664 stop:3800 length:1137 start_codon:yes stop_codon:yes gene_type:complete
MPATIEPEKRDKLFTQIRHLLGAPLRGVELEDEMLDTAIELAILDYGQYVQDWLIENQWSSLYGQDLDVISLTNAFLTRDLSFETSFTYAYSKIVGLQAGGPYQLKQDYISLSAGTQIYQIPAGREINEIMWYSRAELNESFIDPFLGAFGGFGGGMGMGGPGGFAQMGIQGSYFLMPAFDILLRMQDRNLKNRLIGGEMTYRITAGAGGVHGPKYVHLYNVPGGRFDFGSIMTNQERVWYWYYDSGPENRDDCLDANKDIVLLPSDVTLDEMTFTELNPPAQAWVRRYFFAKSKEMLGRVRGKFSGNLKTPDSELTMEYADLLSESKDEVAKLVEELMARLERLRNDKMLERKALEAENLNKSLGFRPINPGSIFVI